jgi:hypothetical protein
MSVGGAAQARKKTRKRVMRTGHLAQCQCSASCRRHSIRGEAFCAYHLKAGCPTKSPLSGSEPAFDPNLWNSRAALRLTHNCFSYAMNVHDPNQLEKCNSENCSAPFHQPGSAAGYSGFTGEKPKTCSNMAARILGDNPNIQMSRFTQRCPRNTSKIALVVDQSDDYHFLRQDSNGWWSQKSGARPVTNKDAGGHKIWNPQLCDLDYRKDNSNLNYDIFCGYMCVPRRQRLHLKVGGGRTRRRSRTIRASRRQRQS